MKKSKRIAVVTGDHFRKDPEKLGGVYAKEDLIEHEKMVTALRSLAGYELVDVYNDHTNLLKRLKQLDCELVLNFCDTGYRNTISQEIHIPVMLDLAQKPYSGSPPSAIINCYDKAAVSLVAEQLGLAVAKEIYLPHGQALPEDTVYPALLKPNKADGSLGITKDAMVRNQKEGKTYLSWLNDSFPRKDVLIQEYLPGPEYGMGVIGNLDLFGKNGCECLVPLEVDFEDLPKGLTPILSYESKADPDSPYWTDIKFRQARLCKKEIESMQKDCMKLFLRLGLQDYARFDFRRDKSGRIKLMEVNPNPAWASDGKLAHMASLSGYSYAQMLEQILRAAFARIQFYDKK